MKLPSCSIVITAYNSANDLPECIEGLLAQDYPEFEIILVNNASTDETEQIAERYAGHIVYVELAVNRAVTGGYNAGAALAQGEVLVFINADTVPLQGWLRSLIEPLHNNQQIGLTTSCILLYEAPELINTCGNSVTWTGITICRGYGEPAKQWNTASEVMAVSGAAFAIRANLFRKVGGFDDTLEFYLDDTDLSLRSLLAGYRIWYVPESQILHKYTFRFSPDKAFYIERNRWLTMFKLLRFPTLCILLPGLILGDLMAWTYAAFKGRNHLQAKMRSWLWLWRNLPIVLQLRQKTQSIRKVPDRELLRILSSELRFTGTVSGEVAQHLDRGMYLLLLAYGGFCRRMIIW